MSDIAAAPTQKQGRARKNKRAAGKGTKGAIPGHTRIVAFSNRERLLHGERLLWNCIAQDGTVEPTVGQPILFVLDFWSSGNRACKSSHFLPNLPMISGIITACYREMHTYE
jgi:hypothetical protein